MAEPTIEDRLSALAAQVAALTSTVNGMAARVAALERSQAAEGHPALEARLKAVEATLGGISVPR